MHPSYFLILDAEDEYSKKDLTLSGEAAEWLFHIKLWDSLNDKHLTDFAQYEEENLEADIVEETVSLLLSEKNRLVNGGNKKISFCYGWNQNKEELICLVDSQILADELGKLIILLREAVVRNKHVYCQL
jgi:hypothetical protein